jgi:branched-chain amino acid transport system permease protein
MLAERPRFYVFCAVLLVAVLLLFRKLLAGGAGIVIHGLAHNEGLVASLGVDVLPYRTAVFAFGAFVAGLAGSLYAHYFGFISPEAFGFWTAVNALIMNVLGGAGMLLGPVAGAVLLVPLPELFRDAVAFQRLYFGLTLLALMLFLGGLLAGRAGRVK